MTTPVFMVSFDSTVPDDDVQALGALLAPEVDVHIQRGRGVADQWQTIVAVARDLGSIAVSLSALLALADKIIKWRSGVRTTKPDADARIRAPNREELNLLKASDDEVRAWMRKLAREKSER